LGIFDIERMVSGGEIVAIKKPKTLEEGNDNREETEKEVREARGDQNQSGSPVCGPGFL
jgi:hypothetical protein